MARLVTLALASLLVTACRLAPAPESGAAPDAGLQVRLVRLAHCSAAELAPIVQEVYEHRVLVYDGFGEGAPLIFATATAIHAPPAAAAPQQIAIAHAATNTLVLLGSEAELREILDLVERLDVQESQVHSHER
jgi:hypothetical protein